MLKKKIFKILVGIDGSEYSFNAAMYAYDLSIKYNSEIILLSVVPSKIHYGDSSGIFGAIPPSYFDDYKRKAEKWFTDIINQIKNQGSFETEKRLKTDVITSPYSTSAAILNYAERKEVDLIIVGNKGSTGFKKMLLGSVASDIITYSYCPVLVVK